MNAVRRQKGVALFTAVFLIAAVGVLGATVALIAGQQQLATAQTLDQTRAYYAARARLEEEIANLLPAGACPALPSTDPDTFGFTTQIDSCTSTMVSEGGSSYDIYTLAVTASRGDLASGTLVRRTIRVQVTAGP